MSRIENSLAHHDINDAEVIVVDNASSDNTGQLAASIFERLSNASYRVVNERKQGLIHARWAGIRAAKGDIICFIDDDNWTSDSYFETVVDVFNNQPEVGFFGCSTELPAGISFPPEIAPYAKSYAVGNLYQKTGILQPGQTVWGAGMAARRHALLAIVNSTFQPILHGRTGSVQLAGDDSELACALTITGWRGWYQSEALIEHAIDTNRMNPQKLLNMHQGFGASDSIISCYLLYLKDKKILAINYYVPWYILKILKSYTLIFIKKLLFQNGLGYDLLKSRSIAAARFFMSNQKSLVILKRNFSILSKIKKSC